MDQEKKVKTEKKEVVADITEIIQSGTGKTGLSKLANDW
jgi:ribosome-binding protein aMBF1 (putative translation factor)